MKNKLTALLLSCALLAMPGCALLDTPRFEIDATADAPSLFAEATDLLHRGQTTAAEARLNAFDENFAFSPLHEDVLLRLSEIALSRGDHEALERVTARSLSLYPAGRHLESVAYLNARSHAGRMLDSDFDQGAAQRAIDGMRRFLERFPDSALAEDARAVILDGNERIAEAEMRVGMFYLERGAFDAALGRFKHVLVHHRETSVFPEAIYRVGEANAGLGIDAEIVSITEVLLERFPDSEWTARAVALRERRGL